MLATVEHTHTHTHTFLTLHMCRHRSVCTATMCNNVAVLPQVISAVHCCAFTIKTTSYRQKSKGGDQLNCRQAHHHHHHHHGQIRTGQFVSLLCHRGEGEKEKGRQAGKQWQVGR